MAQNDVPICQKCRTATILVLVSCARCIECGERWNGSEYMDIDGTTEEVVTDILRLMWAKGHIEPRTIAR